MWSFLCAIDSIEYSIAYYLHDFTTICCAKLSVMLFEFPDWIFHYLRVCFFYCYQTINFCIFINCIKILPH